VPRDSVQHPPSTRLSTALGQNAIIEVFDVARCKILRDEEFVALRWKAGFAGFGSRAQFDKVAKAIEDGLECVVRKAPAQFDELLGDAFPVPLTHPINFDEMVIQAIEACKPSELRARRSSGSRPKPRQKAASASAGAGILSRISRYSRGNQGWPYHANNA